MNGIYYNTFYMPTRGYDANDAYWYECIVLYIERPIMIILLFVCTKYADINRHLNNALLVLVACNNYTSTKNKSYRFI